MEQSEYNQVKYLHENFAVVMCGSNKASIQKHSKTEYQKAPLEDVFNNLVNGGFVAILAGARSNNLEILDFDLKNAKDPEAFYENYIDLIALKLGDEFLGKMVVQRTPSGGFHWLYRTDKVDGNKKISKGENKQAIVESRGEGGYFVCAPSEGYILTQGKFSSIPTITSEEKKALWEAAESMSELKEVEITREKVKKQSGALTNEYNSFGDQTNYWDVFNQDCDYLSMLEQDGWSIQRKKGDKYLMRRPGKDEDSWSADLDLHHEYGKLLYVYTTSTVLESEHAYLPSTYLIEYRFGGDAKRAYDFLIENGYAPPRKEKDEIKEMEQPPQTKEEAVSIFDKYSEFKVDSETYVENPVPIITVNDVGALHTGELLTISGESKSGKSAVISAMIAKVLNPNADGFDMIKTKKTGFPILHFDTEQPVHRHKHNLKSSVMKRAHLSKYPNQLMSYNLRRMAVDERKLAVSELVESANIEYGGVFMVILDGIADFVYDVNDNVASAKIVDWMLQMSTTFNCGVLCVIHLNPTIDGGFVKQRGHLGSELQRKTDSLLIVRKASGEGVEESIFSAHYLRNGGIQEFGEHKIHYDKETGMHQVVKEDAFQDYSMNAHERAIKTAMSIAGMTSGEAVKHLVDRLDYKTLKQANEAIKELIKYEYIESVDLKYQILKKERF